RRGRQFLFGSREGFAAHEGIEAGLRGVHDDVEGCSHGHSFLLRTQPSGPAVRVGLKKTRLSTRHKPTGSGGRVAFNVHAGGRTTPRVLLATESLRPFRRQSPPRDGLSLATRLPPRPAPAPGRESR